MAKVKGGVKTLLDIDGVVCVEALKNLRLPGATAPAATK